MKFYGPSGLRRKKRRIRSSIKKPLTTSPPASVREFFSLLNLFRNNLRSRNYRKRRRLRSIMFLFAVCLNLGLAADPPGPGPFGSTLMLQPVPGAPRGVLADGWKQGKLCDVR